MSMMDDLATMFRDKEKGIRIGEHMDVRAVAGRYNDFFKRIAFDLSNNDPEHFRTLKNRLADASNPENEHFLYGLIWRPRRGLYASGVPDLPGDMLDAPPTDYSGATYRRIDHPRRSPVTGEERDPAVRRERKKKFNRQEGVCIICGRDIGHWIHAVIAHIKPLADGGADESENTAVAHNACNMIQGVKTIGEARAVLMRKDPPAMIESDVARADRALDAARNVR